MKRKFIDYYKVLNIERTASQLQIKEAYYKLARKYHPDINIFNDASIMKFTIINQAYNVLGDLENRLKYKIMLEMHDEAIENEKLRRKLSDSK